MSSSPIVWGIVAVYLAGMLALGIWASRKRIKNADDFMVAGRRLPWYIVAATLAATEVGGGSCMGVTQKAYGKWGLGSAWYIWTMAITFGIFALAAPMLTRTRCRTIPQFFRERYGKVSAVCAGVLMILSLVGLTAVQMVATGKIIQIMTNIDYVPSVIVSGLVVIFYTYLGGMWSVSLTDFVQWIFICVGMAAAIPYAIAKAGGLAAVQAALPATKLSLFAGIGYGKIVSLVVIYCTSFLVGQEAMQRLYSAKNEGEARKGAAACAGFYLLFGFIPPIVGLVAWVLAGQGVLDPAQIAAVGRNGMLPMVAAACLPAVLTGILFAGLISATMSSADSDLLGAASIWANDIAPILYGEDLDLEDRVANGCPSAEEAAALEAQTTLCMKRSRLAVAIVGIAGMVIAAIEPKDIIDMLVFSFSLRAAGPFFPFLLGHFWPKGSSAGATTAIVGATVVVTVLKGLEVGLHGLDPVIPGLLAGLVLFVGVSLLAPDRGE